MAPEKVWRQWLERFYNLRRDKSGSHERPHKPVLLLTILDLLDRGAVTKNEIQLTPELTKTFKRYFEVVRQRDDQPTIENPFYHLCGDGFWQLVPKPGERPPYEPGNASRVPTLTALREIYGCFDDTLWAALLTDAHSRHQLREALIARYFPEHRDQLAAVAAERLPAPKEDALRDEPPGRDGAFRHTILEIYDYRCAACGIRVKISDALSLVEAAHIIPFGVSRNDKPDNGLALCPNHHWAMDRFLIAPWTQQHLASQLNPTPDAFNLGLNDGPAAGQTMPQLHFHVIPRYTGDVPDPRGGIRHIIPSKAPCWQ